MRFQILLPSLHGEPGALQIAWITDEGTRVQLPLPSLIGEPQTRGTVCITEETRVQLILPRLTGEHGILQRTADVEMRFQLQYRAPLQLPESFRPPLPNLIGVPETLNLL